MPAKEKGKDHLDVDGESGDEGGRRRSGRDRRPPARFGIGESEAMTSGEDSDEDGGEDEESSEEEDWSLPPKRRDPVGGEDAYKDEEGRSDQESDRDGEDDDDDDDDDFDSKKVRNAKRARLTKVRGRVAKTAGKGKKATRSKMQKDGQNSKGVKNFPEAHEHGIVPNGQLIANRHGYDEHLLTSAAAMQLSDVLTKALSGGRKRVKVMIDPDERRAYMLRRSTTETTSFLTPDVPLQNGTDGTSAASPTFEFTERMPPCGEQVEVTMGVGEREKKVFLNCHEATTLQSALQDDEKPGCLLNVGSHVYSLDWSPKGRLRVSADDEYVCVATGLEPFPRTKMTDRLNASSSKEPATLQIWSISPFDWQAKLELVLCFDQGRIACVRWSPLLRSFGEPGGDSWMGVVAVAMQDGTVGVYAVPLPDALFSTRMKHRHQDVLEDPILASLADTPLYSPVYLRLEALVKLDVYRGVPMCMEWQDVDRLAVGYSDGHLSVWSLTQALRQTEEKLQSPTPQVYVRVSGSALSGVTWDRFGRHVYSSAYDGSVYATTLTHAEFSTTLAHARDTANAIAFDQMTAGPVYERIEDATVRTVDYSDGKLGSRGLYVHYGRVRTLSTSAYHPYCASGGADGAVKVANTPLLSDYLRRWLGSGVNGIFRLDVEDRSTGALRMKDYIKPMHVSRQAPDEVRRLSNVFNSAKYGLTMGWHPAICVTAVRWNANYSRENWLAAGMAVGLVRIDVVGSGAGPSTTSDEEREMDVD